MNYSDAVRYLYSLGNEVKTAKLGLERIQVVLQALGNPHQTTRFIHVAGTNGKGSTCAMIEAGLRAAGLRTGLYVSPHLIEPTERIQVAGNPITPDQFARAFCCVHQAAEELLRSGAIDLHPTYFETVTAMGFLLFQELQAEIVVLEVGLGGRLDATNVITPELAVITPIDYDHQNFLGDSIRSIAAEKAGILKPGVPAIFSAQRPEAEQELSQRASALRVPVTYTESWEVANLEERRCGSRFVVSRPARTIHVDCPLAGRHQAVNALTAVAALDALSVPVDAIERGMRETRWPGRLERISERPEIIVDGAHNPAGAAAVAAYIDRYYHRLPEGRRITLIFGVMRDKAVSEMAALLFPLADRVIVTAPPQERAMAPEMIREATGNSQVLVAPCLAKALEMATSAPGDAIFITGSLFLAGEAKALISPGHG